MRPALITWAGALAISLVCQPAPAQNVNPDISVTGDLRSWWTDDTTDPDQKDFDLDIESVEVALQGHLNPYARADLFVGYHHDEFVLEEAYVTILRGLPGGLQVKAGKYRLDFGKLNQLHPHAYSFLDTPLAHQLYLGEEGISDMGVNANLQVPVGELAVTVSANLLKGDFVEPLHEHEDVALHSVTALLAAEGEEAEEIETDLGSSARVSIFVPTGDYAGFEVGVNALWGTLDANADRSVEVAGVDVKYRWAPSRFRSLTLQGEWLRSRRDLLRHHDTAEPRDEVETVRSAGYYAFADYHFAQRWNLGAILERAEAAEDEGTTVRRSGVFGGFQVMEETTMLRLLLRRSDSDLAREPLNEAVLQLVFSLGPHRAHWF